MALTAPLLRLASCHLTSRPLRQASRLYLRPCPAGPPAAVRHTHRRLHKAAGTNDSLVMASMPLALPP